MAICLIGVGSNQGDRAAALALAIRQLSAPPQVNVLRASRDYLTSAIGGPRGQEEFLNAALLIETSLPPEQLLARMQAIENEAGRTAGPRWGPRVLDLDLLLYDDLEIASATLQVPHPRMIFRHFVLAPAAEIAADLWHPQAQRTVGELWQHLQTAVNYVALTGPAGSGKTVLAERVAARTGAQPILQQLAAVGRITEMAGPRLQREIQFLDHRMELLRQITDAVTTGSWISDFWLEQTFARQDKLPVADADELERVWQQRAGAAVTPKLVVLLAKPDAGQTAMTDRAAGPNQPPLLTLDPADAAWNEQELAAAMQAMQIPQ